MPFKVSNAMPDGNRLIMYWLLFLANFSGKGYTKVLPYAILYNGLSGDPLS